MIGVSVGQASATGAGTDDVLASYDVTIPADYLLSNTR